MYRVTICNDLYGCISSQQDTHYISFVCENNEEVKKIVDIFINKGFSIGIKPCTEGE